MRLLTILLFVLLCVSCATKTIKYDREKIINKYVEGYDVILDSEKVNFQNVYLDKDNLEKITVHKKIKTIQIDQIIKTELFYMNQLNLDSLNKGRDFNFNKIGLIIIDGITLTEGYFEDVRIDPNSIKYFEVLSQEKLNNLTLCGVHDGAIILIATK